MKYIREQEKHAPEKRQNIPNKISGEVSAEKRSASVSAEGDVSWVLGITVAVVGFAWAYKELWLR